MKECIRGYIFISSTQNYSPAQLILSSVEHLGANEQVCTHYIWREENEDWIDVPLSELCRVGRGAIRMYIGGLDCAWHFVPNVRGYHLIRITIFDPLSLHRTNSPAVERLLVQWQAYCQATGAEFAYFQQVEQAPVSAYHIEDVFLALQHNDLLSLLTTVWPCNQLYLGSRLVTYDTGRLLQQLAGSWHACTQMQTRTFPGGAMTVHTSIQTVEAEV